MAKANSTQERNLIRESGLGIETQAAKLQILLELALEIVDEGGSETLPPSMHRRLNTLSCLLEYAQQAAETVTDMNGQVLTLSIPGAEG